MSQHISSSSTLSNAILKHLQACSNMSWSLQKVTWNKKCHVIHVWPCRTWLNGETCSKSLIFELAMVDCTGTYPFKVSFKPNTTFQHGNPHVAYHQGRRAPTFEPSIACSFWASQTISTLKCTLKHVLFGFKRPNPSRLMVLQRRPYARHDPSLAVPRHDEWLPNLANALSERALGRRRSVQTFRLSKSFLPTFYPPWPRQHDAKTRKPFPMWSTSTTRATRFSRWCNTQWDLSPSLPTAGMFFNQKLCGFVSRQLIMAT